MGPGLIVVALLHQELLSPIGVVQLLGVTTHHGVEEGLGRLATESLGKRRVKTQNLR